ncbi:MAG: NAD(P)(+) transhydrogenase (Re/Si-specific) subunit beta [Chloroflexaceae bacterium]|nr:NAD(P)(+) transhydrogenase (Re/Si-specific) subunit beta [Chloroflexaceae bacterium]
MSLALVNLSYLLASALFIYGLKGLTHPRTAVRGNLLGAVGMLLAVVATLIGNQIIGLQWVLLGLVIGAAIGALMAQRVEMTAMPQMVALLNGFGGAASFLVAGAELTEIPTRHPEFFTAGNLVMTLQFTIATALSGLIGSVTLTGSFIAYGKLEGFIKDPPRLPGQQAFNILLLLVAIGLGVWLVIDPTAVLAYWGIVLVAAILGVSLVIGIGGADMPVVIALLNSYSGLAACATGFVLNNTVLVITGSLVGASGLILSAIMCRAMNRSLTNVLFGVWVAEDTGPSADEVYGGKVKSSSPEELAMLLDGVGRVVIVPGFGMAVAQAQHAVRELTNLLEARGTEVEFAIHPVAGRMPGHMNVLLAEADIPYEKLKEMDEINPTFEQTDVAIVIGANDVVNPEARTNPSSPIAGMPILDVLHARSVIVVKRSLSPGFAGIPNPLFAADNTVMLFADAKKGMLDLISALKESA